MTAKKFPRIFFACSVITNFNLYPPEKTLYLWYTISIGKIPFPSYFLLFMPIKKYLCCSWIYCFLLFYSIFGLQVWWAYDLFMLIFLTYSITNWMKMKIDFKRIFRTFPKTFCQGKTDKNLFYWFMYASHFMIRQSK